MSPAVNIGGMISEPPCRLSLLALLVTAVVPAAAAEVDFGFSFSLSNRINVKENFLNTEGSVTSGPGGPRLESPLNLRFDNTEIGYSLLLAAGARLEAGSAFSLVVNLDSGELKYRGLSYYQPRPVCSVEPPDPRCDWMSNGRPIADEAAATGFTRELYSTGELGRAGWVSWWAGKRRRSLGSGYLLDNYVLGGGVDFNLERRGGLPLRLEVEGLLPNGEFNSGGKRSPLVKLEISYLLSFFEEVSLWGAWFHDGDDALGEVLLYTMADMLGIYGIELLDTTSRGDFFWVGIDGNKVFERASLFFTAAVEFGWADLGLTWTNPLTGQPQSQAGSARMLGGMVDASFYFDLTDWFTAGAFFLFLSGETGDSARDEVGGRYNSFVSVYPYITRTNIFFSGGMNQNFSARSFSPSGVNGRGVIAPGLSLGLDITEKVLLRLGSALLFSHGVNLQAGSRFYGWETDLNLEWNIRDFVSLLFEADYLLTGGFFDFEKPLEARDGAVYTSEPDAWKILIGLDFYL